MKVAMVLTIGIAALGMLAGVVSKKDTALASYSECVQSKMVEDSYPAGLQQAWNDYQGVCNK